MSRSVICDIGVNGDIVDVLVIIPKDELQALWQDSGMADRYASGEFTDLERRPGTVPGDPALRARGATTAVIIVKDKHGHQIATLYETVAGDGSVIERHTIDYWDAHRVKWHRADRKAPVVS